MRLHIAPDLWHALCRTAERHPTCTLRLHQHGGYIKSFTVEHGPYFLPLPEAEEAQGTGSDVAPYGLETHSD